MSRKACCITQKMEKPLRAIYANVLEQRMIMFFGHIVSSFCSNFDATDRQSLCKHRMYTSGVYCTQLTVLQININILKCMMEVPFIKVDQKYCIKWRAHLKGFSNMSVQKMPSLLYHLQTIAGGQRNSFLLPCQTTAFNSEIHKFKYGFWLL